MSLLIPAYPQFQFFLPVPEDRCPHDKDFCGLSHSIPLLHAAPPPFESIFSSETTDAYQQLNLSPDIIEPLHCKNSCRNPDIMYIYYKTPYRDCKKFRLTNFPIKLYFDTKKQGNSTGFSPLILFPCKIFL